MNRHCIPGLTMSTALTGNPLAGGLEQLKRCTQGLAQARIAYYANASVLTRKNRTL